MEKVHHIIQRLIREGTTNAGQELAVAVNEVIRKEGEEGVRRLLNAECSKLVERCLETEADTPESREDREKAIRTARSILLLTNRQNPDQADRFPKWVNESLLQFAFAALEQDITRFSRGESARAADLGVMLCANIATFELEQKRRFGELLWKLCRGADEWQNPFIMDRLLILRRILSPDIGGGSAAPIDLDTILGSSPGREEN